MSDPAFQRATILLVEDDAFSRHIFATLLERAGYDVILAEDGWRALRVVADLHASGARPDAMVLDVEMPVIDGVEVIEMLESEPELSGIPVVVLTATPEKVPPGRAVRVIHKADVEPLLIHTLREALSARPAGAPA